MYNKAFTHINDPKQLPSGPGFLLLIQTEVIPYTGYEDETCRLDAAVLCWDVYWTTNEEEWIAEIVSIEKKNNDPLSRCHEAIVYIALPVSTFAQVETSYKISTSVRIPK